MGTGGFQDMPQANDYDVLQKEIAEIKADQKTQDQRITTLERTTDRHDQQIISINEKLNKIEENTTWIKRSITGAITLIYNLLQK